MSFKKNFLIDRDRICFLNLNKNKNKLENTYFIKINI